ncbi:hypothetical protein ACFLU6_07125 [Acidobacteriota bacterium]
MRSDEIQKVKKYLNEMAADVPGSFVEELVNIYVDSQKLFPPYQQVATMIRLLHDWSRDPNQRIISHASEVAVEGETSAMAILAILAKDWPGMADSVIGCVHDLGWNVFLDRGLVVPYKNANLGTLLLVIKLDNKEDYDRYETHKPTLLERIRRAAFGSTAKSLLLAREARKIEMFSRVVEYVDEELSPENVEEITGHNGEAVKFFASRSVEYLYERSPKDLATQIITNNLFLKATRSTGGAIQHQVQNMETVREGLTTITISALQRDLSLDDCLQSIEHAVGKFQLKYNKEFTTGDGITVYRFEIVDFRGKPLTKEGMGQLKDKLDELARGKRFERTRWIETIGGFEHFARAIIPLLVREYLHTSIPQVFLSVSKTTNQFIYFKILMVVPPSRNSGESVMFRCIPQLDACHGILVQTTKPPKEMDGCELDIMDLRADMSKYDNVEEVFIEIRKSLAEEIGEFRDFDEGMRRSDVQKLGEVHSRLPALDETMLKECYYRIEDFYRVSAPVEELVAIIEMADDTLRELVNSDGPWAVRQRTVSINLDDNTTIPTATVITLALYEDRSKLKKCLEVLDKNDFMMSRIDRNNVMILLFRITDKNQPLSEERVTDILAQMETICSV